MSDFISYRADQAELVCQGAWTIDKVAGIEDSLTRLVAKFSDKITFNGQAISKMDSAGALVLLRLQSSLQQLGKSMTIESLHADFMGLLSLLQSEAIEDDCTGKPSRPNPITLLGQLVVRKLQECLSFIGFVGHFVVLLLAAFKKSQTIKWRSVLSVMDSAGYRGLPIVALLIFLVGIVMTYQIALQLSAYGANIYVVDLSGMIIFREFAPLVTAIIAAGRTSTAFAAQIGTMKVNEELDALETMGISAFMRIVLPKVIGLLIALPLLVVWADIFGVLGAMIMAKAQLGIAYQAFLIRFEHTIAVQQYVVGLVKVPFFALVIALVGSYQGFQVAHSADSVGDKTTKSAVQSIFLIIIVDAVFSVIFSLRGI